MTQADIPFNDHVFMVEKHMVAGVWDTTYDTVDTRTQAIVANTATQPLARADAVTRNQALDALP